VHDQLTFVTALIDAQTVVMRHRWPAAIKGDRWVRAEGLHRVKPKQSRAGQDGFRTDTAVAGDRDYCAESLRGDSQSGTVTGG
jgi:hypothetical protein